MDDTISRQAAIDTLHMDIDIIPFVKAKEYVKGAIETVYNRLKDLPSAKSDWIPCSEVTGDGYPEEEGVYYVTEQNYGFYLDAACKQRVTHTSHFINGTFIDRFYSENNSNIIAWMPLPKPYEGEQDDN